MATGGADRAGGGSTRFFALMLGVFAAGGMLASVEALIVPRLSLILGYGYGRALIVQLVYYSSYLVLALPAGALTARAGALRATALGAAVVALGCLLFAGALAMRGFAALLAALLAVSAGVTILQIACNALVATRGDRAGVAARFTLLQGFNSLGTVIGPLLGARMLLGRGEGVLPLLPFLGFAALFGLLALGVAGLPGSPSPAAPRLRWPRLRALLGERRMMAGAGAIFAYVGAEVTLGTLAVNYLALPDRLALPAVAAGRAVSLYWLGAMIGRFAGAWALARVRAPVLLAGAGGAALVLLALAVLPTGAAGAAALLAVGLANSVMFPTIFALAMPADAQDVPAASMLLCMAVVGGAVVPMATGLAADRIGLSPALLVPGACYAAILAYALRRGRGGAAA